MTLRRLLIANRGEIVVRVARTARALGLDTVAVFTDADARSPHRRAADRAVRVASYLDAEALVEAARRTGADAVHPGYGFLAENAAFARAVESAGLVWVGPPADAIEAMGDKARAKARMEQAGVPVVPGADLAELFSGSENEKEDQDQDEDHDVDEAKLRELGESVGFPLVVKAVAGGGGKGLRRVDHADRLAHEVATARSEARAAFGDGRLLLERLVEGARHVEFQILTDAAGHAIHLGERDCTAQRRHQKILEESPSPPLEADPELRRRMGEAALAAALEVGYVGAGTVEMLLAPDGAFYFLEMNTRLQVEHPVTELRTGIDLVAWQLRVAAGESLPAELSRGAARGWAVEARVYAEDPARGFAPSPGTVLRFRAPREIPGVLRVDHALDDGTPVPPDYDPLLAKVIVHGRDRDDALRRLDRALAETVLFGPATNLAFLRHVLTQPGFAEGRGFDTGWVERQLGRWTPPAPSAGTVAAAAALLSVHEGDAGAGSLWGWRSAAGTEGWPVTLRAVGHPMGPAGDPPGDSPGDDSEAEGSDESTAEVWLEPVRPPGRDPRDVYRARVGAGEDRRKMEIDFVLPEASLWGETSEARVCIDGLEHDLRWAFDGPDLWLHDGDGTYRFQRPRRGAAAEAESDPSRVVASMTGRVKEVRVAAGDAVEAGDCLLVLEAMKLETRVEARAAGTVAEVYVAVGDQVAHRQELLRLD